MIQYIAGAAAAGALAGSLLAAWAMGTYKDATWSAATNQLKVEAADVLQRATVEAAAVEMAAQMKVRELEAKHVQEEKSLAAVERRNRALAAELGGLRDPGRRPSRQNAVPGTPGRAEGIGDSSSSGLLSAEASTVLLNAAAEVDALASYARTCYDYVQSVVHMRSDEPKETP